MNREKITSYAITLGSLLGVAAINYTVFHNPIVFFLTFILFVHELAHYTFAKINGANVKLPIFVPFIIFSLGLTQVKDLPDEYKDIVALAGPAVASLSILLFIIFNLFYRMFSTKILFLALAGEVAFNFFGSDGKRYRQARKFKQQTLIS